MLNYKGKKVEKTDTVKSLDEHLDGCVKFVSKDYVCYRKEWLYEHLDEEFEHLKRNNEWNHIKIMRGDSSGSGE